MTRFRYGAMFAVVAGLAGCATSSGLHRSDRVASKAAIEAAVPIGATYQAAWRAMIRGGYRCEYSAGADLDCGLTRNLPGDLFSTRWSAHFDLVDGRVAAIRTGQIWLGL